MEGHFGKCMAVDKKTRVHNSKCKRAYLMTAKFGLQIKGSLKMGLAYMRFLSPQLGLTAFDCQRNIVIRRRLKVKSIIQNIN